MAATEFEDLVLEIYDQRTLFSEIVEKVDKILKNLTNFLKHNQLKVSIGNNDLNEAEGGNGKFSIDKNRTIADSQENDQTQNPTKNLYKDLLKIICPTILENNFNCTNKAFIPNKYEVWFFSLNKNKGLAILNKSQQFQLQQNIHKKLDQGQVIWNHVGNASPRKQQGQKTITSTKVKSDHNLSFNIPNCVTNFKNFSLNQQAMAMKKQEQI